MSDIKTENQQIYNSTDCDYKFDAPVEDIDIPRILTENRAVGDEYVVIMNDGFFMAFFTKKFAKRLLKHNLVKITEIIEDELYGFVDPDTNTTNSIKGKNIRSVGFTFGMIDRNTKLDKTIASISSLAACEMSAEIEAEAAKIAKQNDTRPRREVKIITGK